MAVICPTVTAYEPHGYRTQLERLEAFAERVHIDLMDGEFTPNKSPSLDQIWLPEDLISDIHLMYQRPMDWLEHLIKLGPNMVVFHFEADGDPAHLATHLREAGIKAGLALLQSTAVEAAAPILDCFDHVMVYSGHLGEHGGFADLRLLDKVSQIRSIRSDIEISWDGGINDQNAKALVEAGVDVLNVGGFIQNAADPQPAYAKLKEIIRS